MQQQCSSPTDVLGFTNSLVSYLDKSREKLTCFVDEKKAEADATRQALLKLKDQEQEVIQGMMDQLTRIQLQRGIIPFHPIYSAESNEPQVNTNTAHHLSLLKEQQVQLETNVALAHESLSQNLTQLDGTFLLIDCFFSSDYIVFVTHFSLQTIIIYIFFTERIAKETGSGTQQGRTSKKNETPSHGG